MPKQLNACVWSEIADYLESCENVNKEFEPKAMQSTAMKLKQGEKVCLNGRDKKMGVCQDEPLNVELKPPPFPDSTVGN